MSSSAAVPSGPLPNVGVLLSQTGQSVSEPERVPEDIAVDERRYVYRECGYSRKTPGVRLPTEKENIDIILSQITNTSREQAAVALRKHGNVVDAILELTP